ncbi:MAG: class I SAM-dependent methyltransferase [Bryobacteraceae bacterium]
MTWDERYRRGENLDLEPLAVVREAVAGARPGRALDLACGAGRHALLLERMGWRVTAVDASAAAIEELRRRSAGIDARVADLEAGEFTIEPDAWDLIVDCNYLQRDLVPAIKAGVRPGGLFAGAFPLEGVRPAFLVAPGEVRAWFADWTVLVYREDRRAEIVARR